ncbi:MAG: right-handed parallel beta-helix repeat-containing protein [Vulcanimicrobiota bacterium]
MQISNQGYTHHSHSHTHAHGVHSHRVMGDPEQRQPGRGREGRMPTEAEYAGRSESSPLGRNFGREGYFSPGQGLGAAYGWAGRLAQEDASQSAGPEESQPQPEAEPQSSQNQQEEAGGAEAPTLSEVPVVEEGNADPGTGQLPEGPAVETGGSVPTGGEPLQEGLPAITISGGEIPPELAQYARMDGNTLVIDAGGQQIPPLHIERNDVKINNARISASGQPNILISGASNVTISGSEITGGTTGIKADGASNVVVSDNWLHDMSFSQHYDTTAIEFDNVSGGVIQGNRVSNDENHPFRSDAVSLFESQDLRVTNNELSVVIDEPSSAPLMVEGNSARNIEVANNTISYSGPANVPPGLLGGTNISGSNNSVNGDTGKEAWQLYAYNEVWQDIFYNQERIA